MKAVNTANLNVKAAGLTSVITVQQQDFKNFTQPQEKSIIITNPPYGERLNNAEEEAVRKLYAELGEAYKRLDSWSMYVITSFSGCEAEMGLKAARNRKIYNGMLKTYFYMFPGPKPPRK